MLKHADKRPALVELGRIDFDAVNVGIQQTGDNNTVGKSRYTKEGYFVLDTTVAGNSNRGHEFSSKWDPDKKYDQQVKGVIGPELSEQERSALVEFLKTL